MTSAPAEDYWAIDAASPVAQAIGVPALSWLRVHLTYLWRHRRLLSLAAPVSFTAMVQHRKLFDRDPRLPRLIDKQGAKQFVTEQLGAEWVTPPLWSGAVLPEAPQWPTPFVVKSRHGCNQRRFVREADVDWQAIRRASARWMRSSYGGWLDEWGYRDIPRGLIVEPFIGAGGALPIDYKFYVFGGRVEAIQIHLDREQDHRWLLFDRAWRRLSSATGEPDPAIPASLDRMIAGAETLGRGFDFVRIDFYEVAGKPRFGEMTFYPGSGLDPFDPPVLDHYLGDLWRAAAAVRRSTLG